MFHNPYNQPTHIPNPPVPYNGDIPNGLTPGKQIHVKGHVHPGAQMFTINLITPQNYIALHINPRFSINQIVRNTERGGWGTEERHGAFPFRHNTPFEMIIAVEPDQYKVAVNGQHIFEYRHRIPLNEVTRIAIEGGITCHGLTFVGGAPKATEVFNPTVPSAIPIPGGCRPGKLIQIMGQVPHHSGRFEINMQSGPQYQPNDMALHFNPRWDDPYQGQVVVRTHRRSGGWGSEDRQQNTFPFQKGAPFEIMILCEPGEWKVAVNGQHFISYPHHVPFQSVDHIGLGGDVQINAVKQFH